MQWLKEVIILQHIIGVLIGLGGATYGLYLTYKYIFSKNEVLPSLLTLHNYILVGLLVLWISGIEFLAYFYFYSPNSLHNPKLYAKMIIVAVLTLSSFRMKQYISKYFSENRSQFHVLDLRTVHALLFSGMLSCISWYSALTLGTFKFINGLFSFGTYLGIYFILLMLAWIASGILANWLEKNRDKPYNPTDEAE